MTGTVDGISVVSGNIKGFGYLTGLIDGEAITSGRVNLTSGILTGESVGVALVGGKLTKFKGFVFDSRIKRVMYFDSYISREIEFDSKIKRAMYFDSFVER